MSLDRDRLGRVRRPGQSRGLRPLHPPLPERWTSRALRVAMSESDWDRLESLADRHAETAPTKAQALGRAISELLDAVGPMPDPGPLAWMDWERRKALRLIRPLS